MRSIAGHESRGLKSQDILEESPNGYIISGKAPPEMPRAIKYYAYQLRQYTVTDYPVEYGICHYNLGKIFIADRHHTTRDFEARAKSIENGLHHFRLAVEVFDYDSYPIMYAIINIFIGQLFRERAMLITARSILAKRGVTVADLVYDRPQSADGCRHDLQQRRVPCGGECHLPCGDRLAISTADHRGNDGGGAGRSWSSTERSPKERSRYRRATYDASGARHHQPREGGEGCWSPSAGSRCRHGAAPRRWRADGTL